MLAFFLLSCIVVLHFWTVTSIPIDNGLVLKQKLVSAGPSSQVCNSVADVLFVVDGSTSIGDENFKLVRAFLQGAVATLSSQAPGTWYAAVQFSGIPRTEFSFKTFGNDSKAVEDYFSKLPYLKGTTSIGAALDYAISKEMTAESGNRPDVEDIVVVITDGRSSDDPKPPADRMRALGAQTFAIGITNAIDKNQLVAIAGNNDSVIFVDDFSKLDATARETLLSKRKCVTVTQQPTLTGDPQLDITCGPNSIKIGAETRNLFEGNVYVKNHFADPACRIKADGSNKYAEIDIPIDKCGTNRRRSLAPNGLFIEQSVVFQFHPTVLTKVDRAFKIKCFYMEAEKTVNQEISVSMLTTSFATNQFPMPVCQYSVHSESPTGPPVRFAVIGMQVFHVWECDNTQSGDLFKMRVYNCYVADGGEDRIQLLDEAGCQVDKFLLRTPEYDQSVMRAFQEAHVFKYADRPVTQFQCQIELCLDIDGGCSNTPPLCDGQTAGTSDPNSSDQTTSSGSNSDTTLAPTPDNAAVADTQETSASTSQETITTSETAAPTTEAQSSTTAAETTITSPEATTVTENGSKLTIGRRKRRSGGFDATMAMDTIYQTDVYTDFMEVAALEDVDWSNDQTSNAKPESHSVVAVAPLVCMTHVNLVLCMCASFGSFLLLSAITIAFAIRSPAAKCTF